MWLFYAKKQEIGFSHGSYFLAVSIQVFWWNGISVCAEPAAIEAPSAVLLESSTGKVIFEQNARERRSPCQHYQDHDIAIDIRGIWIRGR